MSEGLENMAVRLNYAGGFNQQDRMIKDKLRSLRKALIHSYQSDTAIVITNPIPKDWTEEQIKADEEEAKRFRCLLNPKKTDMDYDCDTLSIPFEDIELGGDPEEKGKTSKNLDNTIIREGTVFKSTKQNNYWIVILKHDEELAYFRAEIKNCENNIALIDDMQYRVYVRGPVETKIQWVTNAESSLWNELNYSLIVYITKDERTEAALHRHSKIKINGLPYEVQAINPLSGDGIIQIGLLEDFKNSVMDKEEEELAAAEKAASAAKEELPEYNTLIEGEIEIYPYETYTYTITEPVENGTWGVDSDKVDLVEGTNKSVTLEVLTGKSGQLNLYYGIVNGEVLSKIPLTIKSL